MENKKAAVYASIFNLTLEKAEWYLSLANRDNLSFEEAMKKYSVNVVSADKQKMVEDTIFQSEKTESIKKHKNQRYIKTEDIDRIGQSKKQDRDSYCASAVYEFLRYHRTKKYDYEEIKNLLPGFLKSTQGIDEDFPQGTISGRLSNLKKIGAVISIKKSKEDKRASSNEGDLYTVPFSHYNTPFSEIHNEYLEHRANAGRDKDAKEKTVERKLGQIVSFIIKGTGLTEAEQHDWWQQLSIMAFGHMAERTKWADINDWCNQKLKQIKKIYEEVEKKQKQKELAEKLKKVQASKNTLLDQYGITQDKDED